ncbi:MAG: hypothetical protein IPK99_17425 [Flavobacteriales bacterium]|nr:hypothetical protein [Flavobacteriales bacterium]
MIHVMDSAKKEFTLLDTRVADSTQWHVDWLSSGDTILMWCYEGNKARNEVPMTPTLNEKADWMKGP